MKINRKICFVMLLLITHISLVGCMPSNVRIQTVDRQVLSQKKTNLIAGLKEIKDNRPENEKENDQYYEKQSSSTINDNLYKNFKLSGMFEDVLIGKFDNKDVDVILEPNVDHFYYESGANGFTAVSFLFAITGFPGLLYLLAGGSTGEHRAEANLGIKITSIEGNILASGSGEKKLALNANMHNRQTDGLGMIEGRL